MKHAQACPNKLSYWNGSPRSASRKNRAASCGNRSHSRIESAIPAPRGKRNRRPNRSRTKTRTAPGHSARTFPTLRPRPQSGFGRGDEREASRSHASRQEGFLSVLSFLGRDGRLIAKPDFSPMQSQTGRAVLRPSACAAERGAFALSWFCEDDVRRKRTACQSPNLKSEVRQP